MMNTNLRSRRQFLGGACAVAVTGLVAACTSTSGQGSPSSTTGMEAPATLVLVHGAWHRPGPTWNLVVDQLRTAGVPAVTVSLPSAGPEGSARPGLAEDIAAVTQAIDGVGGPVVLVGHSYGGMAVSGAGAHPAVRGLVYLAAFCLAEGQTVNDIERFDPPALIATAVKASADGLISIDPALARAVFYADVPDDLANASIAQLVPSTTTIFSTPQGRPAWLDKPSLYVVCDQDQAIPVPREREMAMHCSRTTVLTSSHAPFLSMPARVGELLADEARRNA